MLMGDITSPGLPPAADLSHRWEQNLVQQASQTQFLTKGIQEIADGGGVESMDCIEKGLDSRVGRVGLCRLHLSRGGSRRTTARYFIANSTEHVQLVGCVAPMTAGAAIDRCESITSLPGSNRRGWDVEQCAGLLNAELAAYRCDLRAESPIVRTGPRPHPERRCEDLGSTSPPVTGFGRKSGSVQLA